ncbi:hypothetical protein NOVA_03965 [Nocardia nova]|uniref:hypothetical protein n=1 Tax=Nocardia nova TaxID=37330 RepID=UPI001C49639D|nr:hypothetical protein [Nocardia nova]MBV7701917.1 hypothetical protein [Nocardia nova]
MRAESVRAAAYVVASELRQRRRWGRPVPRWLVDLDRDLTTELTALGHRGMSSDDDGAGWRSTDDVAAEIGCSARTVRRKAPELGGHKVGAVWVFPTE